MEFNESEFLIETEVPSDEVIISRTDLKGNITYANELFVKLAVIVLKNLLENLIVL